MGKISPYLLLYLLPKNLISHLFGKFAYLNLPQFFSQKIIKCFANYFGVNLRETEFEIEKYQSLGEFFTRNLKPGVRKIGPGVVSPVDGELVLHGQIEEDQLLQAKGWKYTVKDLIQDFQIAEKFFQGYFLTLYLSPKDYHHIHSPISGRIIRSLYVPGQLWPVNPWSVRNIKGLFCRNERIISIIEVDGRLVVVVMVGATNVGSISLSYDNLKSNISPWSLCKVSFARSVPRSFEYQNPIQIRKGEKLGTFNLGSTVILLFEKGVFVPGPGCKAGPVKLGMSLTK